MQTTNIVKINPTTLKVQEIIRQPNTPEFGNGTVAVEVGKELWVGSFRGDRIAIFPGEASAIATISFAAVSSSVAGCSSCLGVFVVSLRVSTGLSWVAP